MTTRKTTSKTPKTKALSTADHSAIVNKGRRRNPRTSVKDESKRTTSADRKGISATAFDVFRNISILQWMIDLHTSYCSRFWFSSFTKNEELDELIEYAFEKHGKKENFSRNKRLSRAQFMKVFETQKCLSGDAGMILSPDCKAQGVEAVQITKPTIGIQHISKADKEKIDKIRPDGLLIDEKTGEVLEYCYCIFDNVTGGMQFSKFVSAENMVFSGNFWRFAQTRGRARAEAALSELQDLKENLEFTDMKIKRGALLGFNFATDDPENSIGSQENNSEQLPLDEEETETEAEAREIKISQDGIMDLDLKPGEKAEPIELQNTPQDSLVEYAEFRIRIVLAAFGIPQSEFNSAKANFSSMKSDRRGYIYRMREPQDENADVLEVYSDRYLDKIWVEDLYGIRTKAKAAGLSLLQLKMKTAWIPEAPPLVDPKEEYETNARAIATGQKSLNEIMISRNKKWKQVAESNKEAFNWYRDNEVPLMIGMPGQRSEDEISETAEKIRQENEDKGIE